MARVPASFQRAILLGSAVLAALLLASACGPATPKCGGEVESRVRPGIDFKRYRTFAIKNPSAPGLDGGEDSDLPENVAVSLKKSNMEAAAALSAAELMEVDPDKETPDLWIASAASTKVEDGSSWDCVSGWKWYGWYAEFDACPWVEPIPVQYKAGTLVVSIVDAETQEVVFGGLASELVSCPGDPNAAVEATIDQIFADYPPAR